MEMFKFENGVIGIKGDEAVLAKIENESLEGVDVSDLRIDAHNLAKLYTEAEFSADLLDAKRYAKMKQLYIETFSAK